MTDQELDELIKSRYARADLAYQVRDRTAAHMQAKVDAAEEKLQEKYRLEQRDVGEIQQLRRERDDATDIAKQRRRGT